MNPDNRGIRTSISDDHVATKHETATSLLRKPERSTVSQSETEDVAGRTPARDMAVFVLDEAVSKCYGKYDLFQEMAGCLFCEADPLLEQMRAAHDSGDARELANTAHRLKGTVAYLGSMPAMEATKCVEAIIRSGDLTAAPAAIDRLATELNRLKDALRNHQPKIG